MPIISKKKNKKIIVTSVVILVAVILAIHLYQTGIWFGNWPSETQFPIRGIDVSHHQGSIDWNAIAASGVEFAYIKATEGGDWIDHRFKEN